MKFSVKYQFVSTSMLSEKMNHVALYQISYLKFAISTDP